MKVLVTGATGFVGRHLVDEILRAGYAVRALVRNPDDAYLLSAQGVELFRGDITDVDSLLEACREVEAVFHLAGIQRQRKKQTFARVNVGGTLNVLSAAQEGDVKRFIHLTPLGHAKNALAQSKAEATRLVETSGLPYTIFRSAPIFGPRGGFLAHLAAFYEKHFLALVPGSSKIRIQPIFIKNLTQMLVAALGDEKYANRIFEVAGPKVYTLDQLADMVVDHIGRKLAKVRMPRFIVRANSYVMSRVTERSMLEKEDFAAIACDALCDAYEPARELNVQLLSVEQGIDMDPWPHFRRARPKMAAAT